MESKAEYFCGSYVYIYLQPEWPLFWLEKSMFWKVDLQK